MNKKSENPAQMNLNASLTFKAISNSEPSGKALSECHRIQVQLTLIASEDEPISRQRGLAALRQYRIKRLTHEAAAAGAVLTYEDLAGILTSSISTIFRDITELRRHGEFIPTRGQVKDIGRNIDNKLQIIQLFFSGQRDPGEIARHFHRTGVEIEKLIERFKEVITLLNRKMPVSNIVKITGLSPRLIQKYIILAEQFKLLNRPSAEIELPKQTKISSEG